MRLIHIFLIATLLTDLLFNYRFYHRGRFRLPCPRQRMVPASTEIFGGHSEEVPPVPIPNTEVKLFSADGTARETVWESRSPPYLHKAPNQSMID